VITTINQFFVTNGSFIKYARDFTSLIGRLRLGPHARWLRI